MPDTFLVSDAHSTLVTNRHQSREVTYHPITPNEIEALGSLGLVSQLSLALLGVSVGALLTTSIQKFSGDYQSILFVEVTFLTSLVLSVFFLLTTIFSVWSRKRVKDRLLS